MNIPVASEAQSITIDEVTLRITTTLADGSTMETKIPLQSPSSINPSGTVWLTMEDLKSMDVEPFFRRRFRRFGPRLKRAGINTVDELLQYSPSQIQRHVKGVGQATTDKLQEVLAQCGLSLVAEDRRDYFLDTDLFKLKLKSRTLQILYCNAETSSIDRLTECTDQQILALEGFGPSRLQEVKDELARHHLSLKELPPDNQPTTERLADSSDQPATEQFVGSSGAIKIHGRGKRKVAVKLRFYCGDNPRPSISAVKFGHLRKAAAHDYLIFHPSPCGCQLHIYKSLIYLHEGLRKDGEIGCTYEALHVITKTRTTALCEKVSFKYVKRSDGLTTITAVPLPNPNEKYYDIDLMPQQ